MARKKFSVQVNATHLDRLPEVAAALRDAGMTIQDEIAELGHFSGVADEASSARLAAVAGVKSVQQRGDEDEPEPADYSIS
jgi:hypothetical protein